MNSPATVADAEHHVDHPGGTVGLAALVIPIDAFFLGGESRFASELSRVTGAIAMLDITRRRIEFVGAPTATEASDDKDYDRPDRRVVRVVAKIPEQSHTHAFSFVTLSRHAGGRRSTGKDSYVTIDRFSRRDCVKRCEKRCQSIREFIALVRYQIRSPPRRSCSPRR